MSGLIRKLIGPRKMRLQCYVEERLPLCRSELKKRL